MEVRVIGQMDNTIDHTFESANRVYDSGGIAPTVNTCGGGGLQPKVIEVLKADMEKEPKIKIKQATKDGFIECLVGGVADLSYPTSTTRRGRVQEQGMISPTLTTENIPSVIEFGDPDFYNFIYKIDEEIYLIRIRKLTPRECWRLMDFTDEDFDKAQKVNSNTQLYKQAGNSICKNVLSAIFGQMIEGKEDIYKSR